MSATKLVKQLFGLMLAVLLMAGCGGAPTEPTATPTPIPPTATLILPTATPAPTPIPTTGVITGKVLSKAGSPLSNTDKKATMMVLLACNKGDPKIECFYPDALEEGGIFEIMCKADDTVKNCLEYLRPGAASVEADGSYTMTDIPPGQYGLFFIYRGPINKEIDIINNLPPVQVGEITEYDIQTSLNK